MDYRTNSRPASKSCGSFALLVIFGGLLLPSALPAQMVIRLSVYNQTWTRLGRENRLWFDHHRRQQHSRLELRALRLFDVK